MNDNPRLDAQLALILEHLDNALASIAGLTEEQFLESREKLQSVWLDVVQIGEYSNKARHEERAVERLAPSIPWRNLYDLRNEVAHAYGEIDHALLYRTVSLHFEKIRRQFQALVGTLASRREAQALMLKAARLFLDAKPEKGETSPTPGRIVNQLDDAVRGFMRQSGKTATTKVLEREFAAGFPRLATALPWLKGKSKT